MLLRDVLQGGIDILNKAGIDNAEYDARQLLAAAYGKPMSELVAELGRAICPGASGGSEPADITYCPGDCGGRISFDDMIARRARHIPLQHITGNAGFMGLDFRVTSDVLIPRQDTETLVETVLETEKDKEISILDLCTGSGCIATALKKLGHYLFVAGSDISKAALDIARENAAANEAEVEFVQSDMLYGFVNGSISAGSYCKGHISGLLQGNEDASAESAAGHGTGDAEGAEGTKRADGAEGVKEMEAADDRHELKQPYFDVLVSNPPYIPSADIEELEPEVRDHDPRAALDGGEDGLYFYRQIADRAGAVLKPGGRLYLEIGYDQAESVSALLDEHGFTDIRVVQDLAGKDRVVSAVRA